MSKQPLLTECANCSSIWSVGTEEYFFQQCDACGWQPGQPITEQDLGDKVFCTDNDN